MRWPESLKQPEWITAVGTLFLVVLTMLILVLTFLLIPDDRWNSFLHYWKWTVAIPLLIVGGLVTAAVYNFRTAVLKVTQQQSIKGEIASQLSVLFQRGQWLQGKVPTVGNSGEAMFCQFWAEEVNGWTNRMSRLLWDNYGEDVARDFTSNVGLNSQEPVGNTHPDAAAAYRTLVHQLRTFQNIRRTLPS
jgi:hypothetical protein